MDHIHFAYPYVFYIFFPLWILVTTYRFKFYKTPLYKYPLAKTLARSPHAKRKIHKLVLPFLRSGLLFVLIFFIARPQWVDRRSLLNVEGVDIIIALDVSGSMQLYDDQKDPRSRFDVAKAEALRFIDKRIDDPIGLVIFAADALSRAPLTLDKQILKTIVHETKLGTISANGTSLGTGLATAVNKLRHSKAKSKIIILLTDGQPTPPTEKISVPDAISLAKHHQVKVYTIAIGNKQGGFVTSAFGFSQQIPDSVDENLLQTIAQETGGKFFRAHKPDDMKKIYNTIDALEKTEYQTNLFSRYYEAFSSFLWLLLLLIFTESFLKFFLWRGIV